MVPSIIKKIAFLSLFIFLSIAFPRQVYASTLTVGSCEGCYATIQEAVDASVDDDIIYVLPGTYSEDVVISTSLSFKTDAGEVVNVTSFDLRNAVNITGTGTFNVDTVYVKTGGSYPPGGGIGDAINFAKTGGVVEVENKTSDRRCLDNHWTRGITIGKNLTLQSASLTLGEEVCLTDSSGTAITITSGDVTIKNFILYDSVNGMKVDGGDVTVVGGSITNNTHGIVTASGTEVNATRLYWRNETGPYNAINNPHGQANDVGNEVSFCPFYTDRERTNLDDTLCRGSSSSSSSSTNPPTCSDQQPGSAPQLFQINRAKDKATLYFTPSRNPVSYYYISYGLKESDEFGTWFSYGSSSGVVSYTINLLSPRVSYYFRVRAGNGCMPGLWSNWLKAESEKADNSPSNINTKPSEPTEQPEISENAEITPSTQAPVQQKLSLWESLSAIIRRLLGFK